MANNSYLYANTTKNPDAPPKQLRLVRQSSNEIPVLWYSLFSKGDGCFRTYAIDNGESLSVPGLIAATPAAVASFRYRLPGLRSWLPSELQEYLEEWDLQLSSVAEPYIQLDAADVILLSESDDLAAFHIECIQALDTGKLEDLVTLFDRVALDFNQQQGRVVTFDPRGVVNSLIGYSE